MRGERRGGIASGPAVAAGLLFVGGESAAGLPPALVDVCRASHGLLFGSNAAGFVSLAEKSSLEKNLGPFCCHKNTSFCMTWRDSVARAPLLLAPSEKTDQS